MASPSCDFNIYILVDLNVDDDDGDDDINDLFSAAGESSAYHPYPNKTVCIFATLFAMFNVDLKL